MTHHRPAISLESRPGVGWRPTLGGRGVGPWLDERSAYFVVQWLTMSRDGVEEVLARLRVDASFEEAIGLPPPRAARPVGPPCPVEVP